MKIPSYLLHLHPKIKEALSSGKPVVALESTIISHGMPYPDNLSFAKKSEKIACDGGAIPATIGLLKGKIHVGLTDDELEELSVKPAFKTASRDLSYVVSQNLNGATTVSSTLAIAYSAGIKVFATGGIGGVHRGAESSFDISQDIRALERYPLIVVTAGAKAILDLPKTLEALETSGVPVVGYKTKSFPAFYSRSSGIPVPYSLNTVAEIVALFHSHCSLQRSQAVVVANPIAKIEEITSDEIDTIIETALINCGNENISGKNVTPFLLKEIVEMTGGRSLKANIALALNNVRLAVEISKQLKERFRF
ncbi:MAG: pseudouridine-5-phosphate glycosidase [Actinobacteria bacterium]|nr:pseudouridine-5-phosphate glycosidase [Actinomycetota bacterium]